jgi:hypothetical protein
VTAIPEAGLFDPADNQTTMAITSCPQEVSRHADAISRDVSTILAGARLSPRCPCHVFL